MDNQGLSKDEKLALAIKLSGQIDCAKAEKLDVYDVLIILAHLIFPGRAVNLSVTDFKVP